MKGLKRLAAAALLVSFGCNAGAVAGLLLLSLGSTHVIPAHRHAVKALRDECHIAEKIITDLMVN